MRTIALLVMMTITMSAAEPAWQDLLVRGEKSPWKKMDAGWIFANDAQLESKTGKLLEAVDAGSGAVWVNGDKGRLANLETKAEYRDVDVHVEFLIGKKSNAGIKFHAVYEIQITDSHGKSAPWDGNDMGGIYPRAELTPKYHHIDHGIPPKVNAAKPAGEWQTLDVTFRAARFDKAGEKAKNAMIVKAVLNGQVIHENLELKHPTGHNYVKRETEKGPFFLQCDHGPTAWRNVKIRNID
jgi:hypothetical protein